MYQWLKDPGVGQWAMRPSAMSAGGMNSKMQLGKCPVYSTKGSVEANFCVCVRPELRCPVAMGAKGPFVLVELKGEPLPKKGNKKGTTGQQSKVPPSPDQTGLNTVGMKAGVRP